MTGNCKEGLNCKRLSENPGETHFWHRSDRNNLDFVSNIGKRNKSQLFPPPPKKMILNRSNFVKLE